MFATVALLSGVFAGKAEALPLASLPAQIAKPIKPAACKGPGGKCPPDRHEVCGPYGHQHYGHHCWCAPC